MRGRPVGSKKARKPEKTSSRKIKSKKDLQKLKVAKYAQKWERKTVDLIVPTDQDVHMHIEIARRVLDYIYQKNICSRHVYDIPAEIRGSLQESTIAAMLWLYGRSNRRKKQPEPHLAVFGRYTTPDFGRRRIAINRESISIPMPAEMKEHTVISWITIFDDRSSVTVRKPSIPFNIRDFLPVEQLPEESADCDR